MVGNKWSEVECSADFDIWHDSFRFRDHDKADDLAAK